MELKPLPHLLAVTNLILHDIEVPDIVYEDVLLRNQSLTHKQRVEVILANPPFGGNVDDETASSFLVVPHKGIRGPVFGDDGEFSEAGRTGCHCIAGWGLTGDGVKARVREMMLKHCDLHFDYPFAQFCVQTLCHGRYKSPVFWAEKQPGSGA